MTGDVIAFDNIRNARDLGRFTGAGGRPVASGRLIRAANPARASEADIIRLERLKLDAIIDFRAADEKQPGEEAFRRRFPVEDLPVAPEVFDRSGFLAAMAGAAVRDVEAAMERLYASFPVRFQPQFGAFLKHLERGETLLFHCTAGKDRTGFAAALALCALGVARADIIADYLLSEVHYAETRREIAEMLLREGVAREVSGALLGVRRSYIDAAFAVIDGRFGGIDAYLGAILGVDVERIQGHYLTAPQN
ncbi:MAG: tyrosine-protein phosphatase [Methylobacteriaceae bacterium]|jgi:protein-tyrosine phosphatase|nr:tyrosine-protein phosphatase [Methylobacteriaceae bacterium]